MAQAKSDLNSVVQQAELVDQQVERRARTAFRRCENSFPRIKTTHMAAAAGEANLELIREQYAQGLTDVTRLIDAQNQAFTAEQVATAAVYEFLINLVELQRSVAWFGDAKSSEQQQAFVDELTAP